MSVSLRIGMYLCLLLAFDGCSTKAEHENWDSMNYAEAACGKNGESCPHHEDDNLTARSKSR